MIVLIPIWLSAFVLLGLSISFAWWYKFWVFEIVGTGYLWFASASLLLLVTSLWFKPLRRQRWLSIVLAIALIFYAETILSWYMPRLRDIRGGGTPITAAIYNVNYQLWDTAATEKVVRAFSADIFGLVEPYKEQAADLYNAVQELYPYYYRAAGGNLSLFSRYRIAAARTDNLDASHHSLLATLDVQGRAVQVIVMRPPAPRTRELFHCRNQVLKTLADYAKQQTTPLILMGDFNTTSWSLYLRQFIQRSGLRSASLGYGIHPTWYYANLTKISSIKSWLFKLVKIPIDHILLSRDMRVDRVMTAPAGTSDHRPLIAEFMLQD